MAVSFATVKSSWAPAASRKRKLPEKRPMIFSWPAGTWLVDIASLVIIGIGLWNAYRGIAKKFRRMEYRRDA